MVLLGGRTPQISELCSGRSLNASSTVYILQVIQKTPVSFKGLVLFISAESGALLRLFRFQFFCQQRDDLVQITDNTVVSDIEDRSVFILVYGNNEV